MAKRNRFPLIGVTLATPALTTAGGSHASVATVAAPQTSYAASVANSDAHARLKSSLLELGRVEKLRIAADRVRLADASDTTIKHETCPQSVKAGGARAHVKGAAKYTAVAACRTGSGRKGAALTKGQTTPTVATCGTAHQKTSAASTCACTPN
jgi:hypothetical protein